MGLREIYVKQLLLFNGGEWSIPAHLREHAKMQSIEP